MRLCGLQVVDPMGSIDGWVDPEVQAMEKMIHSAIDLSFDERNRAKEGAHLQLYSSRM